MIVTRLLAIVGLAALAGLTACGSVDGPGAQPGSPSPTGSPTSTPAEDLPVPSGSSSRGYLMEVRGTITDGVEAGCLVFTPQGAAADGSWVLIGNTAGLAAGQTVTLRGARMDDVMTTCQQGFPFRVEAVLER